MNDLNDESQGMMCAVCGRNLTKRFGSWFHTGGDHPAVPVPYDESLVVSECDFCSEEVPLASRMYLPVDDFTFTFFLQHEVTKEIKPIAYDNKGGYGCCMACAEYLHRDDWVGLKQRCEEIQGKEMIDALDAIWGETRKHITGSVRPWRYGDHITRES